jgi:hypothetical protein
MTKEKRCCQPKIYKINVEGFFEEEWLDWFDGFTINSQKENDCLIIGPVSDQAALHGLLNKIRELGLPLLSVERIENDGS